MCVCVKNKETFEKVRWYYIMCEEYFKKVQAYLGTADNTLRVWNKVSWFCQEQKALSRCRAPYTVMLRWQLLCLETQ